jgi:transposase
MCGKKTRGGVAMSRSPEPIFNVPERTTEEAHATFPRGNRYMMMRDELGTSYRDDPIANLYPSVGQSAEMPWRLALVIILQCAEHLTDCQTADAVRGRIDWKSA